jgi:hypothetical protein
MTVCKIFAPDGGLFFSGIVEIGLLIDGTTTIKIVSGEHFCPNDQTEVKL